MIDTQNISFPLTLEAFTAMQRTEMGREINETEMEIFSDIVEGANAAYEAATKGDFQAVVILLEALNSVPVCSDCVRHIVALWRAWVLLGCKHGSKILKATIEHPGGLEEMQ